MIICSFTDHFVGLNEVPKTLKGKQLHKWILNNLKYRDRISCFELSEMPLRSVKAFMYLERIGKFKTDNKKFGFPYLAIVKC